VSIASGTWPVGLQLSGAQAAAAGSPYPSVAAAEGSNFSANTGDVTLTGAVNAAQTMTAYTPSAILGLVDPKVRAVAIVGDSIASGFTDVIAYDFGYIVRALTAASIGYLNLGHKGESASQFVINDSSFRRKRLLQYCTDAIVNYGTNDLAANNATYFRSRPAWSTSGGTSPSAGCPSTRPRSPRAPRPPTPGRRWPTRRWSRAAVSRVRT
jgi:hypothetical protein